MRAAAFDSRHLRFAPHATMQSSLLLAFFVGVRDGDHLFRPLPTLYFLFTIILAALL
jgi:hypothetical protein